MSYAALVLDRQSQTLLSNLVSFFPEKEWQVKCHHMTLEFPCESHSLEGRQIEIEIDSIAKDNFVIAFGVGDGGEYSANQNPHITAAVNFEGGGRPIMSNQLDKWIPIAPFKISGKVEIVG